MRIADIEQIIEAWAPRWTAWERDNVGLQVGDQRRDVSRILVALDITDRVVDEARTKRAGLIVSHHPLLFRPPSSVTASNEIGRIVLKLAESKIAAYAAHTNLDNAKHGVNFVLAKSLGLKNIRFLAPLGEALAKIVVFVPHDAVDRVADALSSSGAGVIGEYSSCSFRTDGKGTFRGSRTSKPSVGKAGVLEKVDEVRLEMLVPRANIVAAVAALKTVHPYEEIAYDVYPLSNENPNFGMGAVGELATGVSLRSFLDRAKKTLSAEALRYSGDPKRTIKRVAVCGGSGSELLSAAIATQADVFITADVRYHTFHAAEGRIALVDAGHWETEHLILEPLAEYIRREAAKRKNRLSVSVTRYSTNPTHFL
jgi:dinuclear metal center YbgI/SA1388 family protein